MVGGFPSTRLSLRSQMRTRQTRLKTSRRGSSTTTHPRTTQSYQGRRKEVEEEHNGEVGGSKVEKGRVMVGEVSSRRGGVRKRAREDVVAEIREDRKDKKMAKEELADAQVGIWRAALTPAFHFQLRLTHHVLGFAENAARCFLTMLPHVKRLCVYLYQNALYVAINMVLFNIHTSCTIFN